MYMLSINIDDKGNYIPNNVCINTWDDYKVISNSVWSKHSTTPNQQKEQKHLTKGECYLLAHDLIHHGVNETGDYMEELTALGGVVFNQYTECVDNGIYKIFGPSLIKNKNQIEFEGHFYSPKPESDLMNLHSLNEEYYLKVIQEYFEVSEIYVILKVMSSGYRRAKDKFIGIDDPEQKFRDIQEFIFNHGDLNNCTLNIEYDNEKVLGDVVELVNTTHC